MQTNGRVSIEKKFSNVYQLPTLPEVYSRLRQVLSNPKTSAQEVASIIEQDQALSSKVLKIVNSAFYGFPQRVSTISHATVILGFNEIRNIAFSASVINMFSQDGEGQLFDYKGFWEHALGVAVCARIIAKKVGTAFIKNPEEAFIAGLMHDVGKITQEQYMHKEYLPVLELAKENKLSLREAEKEILGFDHQEVGEYLAENWNLPSILSVAIGYHHTPRAFPHEDPSYPMVCVVHIANTMVRALNLGWGGDRFVPNIESSTWEALKLTKSDIEKIMNDTVTAVEELTDMGILKT